MRYSKIIIALVIALNAIFTTAVLVIYNKIGSEPTMLIGAWFAFTTGEIWALAMLKRNEIRKDKEDNTNEN